MILSKRLGVSCKVTRRTLTLAVMHVIKQAEKSQEESVCEVQKEIVSTRRKFSKGLYLRICLSQIAKTRLQGRNPRAGVGEDHFLMARYLPTVPAKRSGYEIQIFTIIEAVPILS